MPGVAIVILAAALAAQTSSSTTAPAKKAGGLTKLPKLVHYVEAPYPSTALAEKREGTVVLAIDVDAEGVVQRVEVVGAAAPDFDRAAMEAACGFEFEPAEAGELGKVPVRITYRYGFVFRPPPPVVATSSTASAARSRAELAAIGKRGPINLSGTVKEAGLRIPVSQATVEVSISTTSTTTRTSTTTDEHGRFAFRGLPPGKHIVTVYAPFFQRLDNKEEVRPGEALEVLYYVTRTVRNPYEVVVRTKIERKEVARRTLKFEEIERIPGTQGDAIRVIQNLPGVARTPFGLGLLVVRGAPPQDTGVFLDGHRLPILFHFGGIGGVTSVLNSRMLEAIDFMPGGFGPDQGRVSAGAVELKSKFAATDRVHGEAVVDIAGASMFIEGPISKDANDGAFVLALRRSYVDGVLAGVLSAAGSDVSLAPRYYDYQARYDRPIDGDKTKMLTLFAYGSDDELLVLGAATGQGTPDGTQSRTYFHRINPRFSWLPDKDTSLVISPLFGVDYTNTQTTGDATGNQAKILIKNYNVGGRIDGSMRFEPWMKLRAGVDALYYEFASESEIPAFPKVKDFPGPIPTDVPSRKDSSVVPAIIASAYGELELVPFDNLTLWPGLRLDYYGFSAEPQPLIDPRLVDGRILASLDPRLSARYRLSNDVSLKGQAGIYHQPPLPPQFYLNADLPLQGVDQYSLGLEWQLMDRLSLDLQGFYRWGFDISRTSRDVQVVNGSVRPVGFVADLNRRAYGMEMLLKLEKRWGLFGWIAYTLSRSEQKRPDQDEWRAFAFFDQTHNLTMVASYDLGLSWTLSARFRFVTGGGLPKTDQRWYDADRDAYGRSLSAEQNRAPPFHQLDLRIDKRWTWDEWYLEAYLDVQNVYNATNTEVYAPSFDFKQEVAIPSLPIFPLIGVKGVF